MVSQFSPPLKRTSVATLTRNLKLRLSEDLSGDARYNLERIDQLGSTFNINTNNNTVVRAPGDIQFRPEDNSVGGSGTGGTVEFGDPSQPLDAAIINGPLKLLSTDLTHYLSLLSSNTSNQSLTIDTGAADRLLTLGGNVTTSGGNISLVAAGNQTVNLPITNAEVAANAAIAGSKISPIFGNQLVSTEQGLDIVGGTYTTSVRPANTPATNVTLRLPPDNGTNNAVLTTDGAGNTSWSSLVGTGTVTSVGLSLPNIFSVAGSPVTVSGTLTASLINQGANTVLAGPASGPAGLPSFRQLSTTDLTEGTNLFYTSARVKTDAVINSTVGNETDLAPSVSSMKSYVTNSIPNVSQAQVIHVNKNQSGSYTPDGSLNKPYLTIKAALDAISDASAVKKYALLIAPGDYVENSAIRLKGWIDLISLANDTVSISTSDSSRLKWSNNNPGRVFITRIGLSSGIEVLNDNPSGTSGIVLDLNNCDVASIVMNGRGGGRDYIQLRNDTRVSGTTTINSAATTIFDCTLIGTLTMTDTGCVAPDGYGSAITATLRSNYELNVTITNSSYDIYVDAWGNSPIGTLTMTSNSAVPSTFNTDFSSYPGTISLSGSPAPSLNQSILSQAPTKSTPVGNDVVLIADSQNSNSLKKILLSDIVSLSGGSYASNWTSGLSITLTHNLNTRDVLIEVYDNATYETVQVDVVRDTTNAVTLTASEAPTGAGLRVLIKKI